MIVLHAGYAADQEFDGCCVIAVEDHHSAALLKNYSPAHATFCAHDGAGACRCSVSCTM